MAKYRKKPVIIEAFQYDVTNADEIKDFVGDKFEVKNGKAVIHTLEGDMEVSNGDYVIKGVEGEFYPCKPDIFEKTYEKVED